MNFKKSQRVRFISRKNRRFISLKGKILSVSDNEIKIKGDNGEIYTRKPTQKIFLIKEMFTFKTMIDKIKWQQ